MLTWLDPIIIVLYMLGVTWIAVRAGGNNRNQKDYFVGASMVSWKAVSLSIAATETSTLTIVGTPAVAYLGSWTFLQITFGYIVGRTLVALYMLPAYVNGHDFTVYAFLQSRFGAATRVLTSLLFIITRLLADSVRLYATAIPLGLILKDLPFSVSISLVALLTLGYTLVGGVRAVIYSDVVQICVYVAGSVSALGVLISLVPSNATQLLLDANKLQVVDLALLSAPSFSAWLVNPYGFLAGVLGGAAFTLASHGTDQIIVQRLLSCPRLRDAQIALVVSGFLVLSQFALFLWVGSLLWVYYKGATPAALGLSRADEVFPMFVVNVMPTGLAGLMIASILASSMSTLSGSLTALASSTTSDLMRLLRWDESPLAHRLEACCGAMADALPACGRQRNQAVALHDEQPRNGDGNGSNNNNSNPAREDEEDLSSPSVGLFFPKLFTVLFCVLLVVMASTLFNDDNTPVVVIGLSIATFTYGILLSAFLLGMLLPAATQRDAIIGMLASLVVLAVAVFGLVFNGSSWHWRDSFAADAGASIAWPWFTLIGGLVGLSAGGLASLFHGKQDQRAHSHHQLLDDNEA